VRPLALLLLCLALAACTLQGCESAHGKGRVNTPPAIPGSWQQSPRGVVVRVPTWLDLDQTGLKQQAFDEIDTTPPLNVTGIGAGCPQDWTVVIQDPGLFSCADSPTGLAAGLTNYATKTIHVAWRTSGPVALPALAHELAHVAPVANGGGPCANHGPGCKP